MVPGQWSVPQVGMVGGRAGGRRGLLLSDHLGPVRVSVSLFNSRALKLTCGDS